MDERGRSRCRSGCAEGRKKVGKLTTLKSLGFCGYSLVNGVTHAGLDGWASRRSRQRSYEGGIVAILSARDRRGLPRARPTAASAARGVAAAQGQDDLSDSTRLVLLLVVGASPPANAEHQLDCHIGALGP